jgi:8-oxo-dGTP pyrophosphatase MutT (NUDIX family)
MVAPATELAIQRRLMPAMAMARDPKRAGLLKVNVSTVVVDDDRVLMIREGHGRKRGRWNLPGGKALVGERLLETAVRETLEETGYQIKPVGLLGLYIDIRGATKPSLRLHLSAKITGGQIHICGDEVLDVRWFEVDRLRDMSDKKLWNPHLIRQTLAELAQWTGHPLRVLRAVDAQLLSA